MKLRGVLIAIGACAVLLLPEWRPGAQSVVGSLFLPRDYVEACKSVGVRILKRPRSPVTSVALDYIPNTVREVKRRYEFGIGGRLGTVGSTMWQPRVEQQIDVFEVRVGHVPEKPEWQFYRYQGGKTPIMATETSAQVRVVDSISNSEQFQKALWKQGMVRHHLRVTDLRNGDELAEMSYVVDLENGRGCGINAKDAIDVDAFILQAIAAPIVIPEWEKQRRERAIIKTW